VTTCFCFFCFFRRVLFCTEKKKEEKKKEEKKKEEKKRATRE
jgi:hypothetical protein